MKALMSYSGGMDSTALLLKLNQEANEVQCINFYYGSKHNEAERERARKICELLGVKLTEVELPFIDKLFKSDLLKSGGKVPEGHYEEETMKATVVPFRNGIMLSIAAGYAESIGFDTLAIANHSGDHAVYKDCRREFIQPMEEAIRMGTDAQIQLYAPFTLDSKSQVCKIGAEINAEVLNMSWSCYQPVEDKVNRMSLACGRCSTCVERIEAFILAGVPDTTYYYDPDFAVKLLREKGSIK